MSSRYLIYKVSGGLNHMLNQINNAFYLSKLSDRKWIIDCRSGAFKNDFGKYFTILDDGYRNSYEEMLLEGSQDVSAAMPYVNAAVKCKKNGYFVLDKKINFTMSEILESEDRFLFFTYLNDRLLDEYWSITLKPNILREIEKYKISGDYIGLHFRNTDMRHDLDDLVSKVIGVVDIKSVYLATDDYQAYDRLKILLPNNYKIYRNTIPFNNHGKNIHYGNPDKDKVILEALIDMYCLVSSSVFIPSGQSSMSKRIMDIRKKNNFFI